MVLQPEIEKTKPRRCVIAYGSNLSGTLGVSTQVVEVALQLMSSKGLCILQQSAMFRSPAFPEGSGPDFVNGAVLVETDLNSSKLINVLHSIEAELGRTREVRWEARILDLDLIDFGGEVLPTRAEYDRWAGLELKEQMVLSPTEPILPHPRVQDRPFVLIPLRQVAPDWVHPVSGLSVSTLLERFSPEELAEIEPLD